MRWSEIDLDKALWIIPKERAKNNVEHAVPLSDQALAVLRSLTRIKSAKEFVFTTGGDTPVSGFSRAKGRLEALASGEGTPLPRWTLHDLRRTFASGCGRLGVALPTIEKALNHVSGSFAGIVGVYQRHSFSDEKRRAMEAWGSFVERLVSGEVANVVELKAVSP